MFSVLTQAGAIKPCCVFGVTIKVLHSFHSHYYPSYPLPVPLPAANCRTLTRRGLHFRAKSKKCPTQSKARIAQRPRLVTCEGSTVCEAGSGTGRDRRNSNVSGKKGKPWSLPPIRNMDWWRQPVREQKTYTNCHIKYAWCISSRTLG